MFQRVTAKLGGQRKARSWSVSPCSDGTMMVQTRDAIGQFYPQTGKGMLGLKGPYFMHLSEVMGAKPFQFPAEFVAACVEACPEPGGSTYFGGVHFAHTVKVI